jgi:hypothetical protein
VATTVKLGGRSTRSAPQAPAPRPNVRPERNLQGPLYTVKQISKSVDAPFPPQVRPTSDRFLPTHGTHHPLGARTPVSNATLGTPLYAVEQVSRSVDTRLSSKAETTSHNI